MKPLGLYFAVNDGAADAIDDDLAAWKQAHARVRAESGSSRGPLGSRLAGAIGGRVPFRRVAIALKRRPA